MEYIAFAHVSYDPREMFEILSRTDKYTARGFLDKLQKIKEVEGKFLVREDGSLIKPNLINSIFYSNLPVIRAEIETELSTIDYFAGIIGHRFDLIGRKIEGSSYPVLPHAHVTEGKGILPDGSILDFQNVLKRK